jgi:hypothetical protein
VRVHVCVCGAAFVRGATVCVRASCAPTPRTPRSVPCHLLSALFFPPPQKNTHTRTRTRAGARAQQICGPHHQLGGGGARNVWLHRRAARRSTNSGLPRHVMSRGSACHLWCKDKWAVVHDATLTLPALPSHTSHITHHT